MQNILTDLTQPIFLVFTATLKLSPTASYVHLQWEDRHTIEMVDLLKVAQCSTGSAVSEPTSA